MYSSNRMRPPPAAVSEDRSFAPEIAAARREFGEFSAVVRPSFRAPKPSMMFIRLTHRDEAHERTGMRNRPTPVPGVNAAGGKLNRMQEEKQCVDPHLFHSSATTATAVSCSIMRGCEMEAIMKKVLGIAATLLSLVGTA